MWKTGFLLNDGAKKKSALFLPVKQYPDVVLFAVGLSDLGGGKERLRLLLASVLLSQWLSEQVCY